MKKRKVKKQGGNTAPTEAQLLDFVADHVTFIRSFAKNRRGFLEVGWEDAKLGSFFVIQSAAQGRGPALRRALTAARQQLAELKK